MGNEDATRDDDVVVYLVKKSEANREKKRRKLRCGANSGASSGEILGEILGEIHANSRKLCQCSRYFEAGMSERWTSDAAVESLSRFEFHLEAHTDVLHYRDCFSRMSSQSLFRKPIPSVKHCIELLKVASQIQCQRVVDAGMKYLTVVYWTADEENQIREFCNSGYFDATSASEDFNARLDLPLTKQERQKKYLDLTMTTLSRHLQFLLPCSSSYLREFIRALEKCDEAVDGRTFFADAFHSIMSDLESNNLQECLIALVRDEAEGILVRIKDNPCRFSKICFVSEVCNFSWLYELSRQENVSQVLVGVILKVEKVNMALKFAEERVLSEWAGMMLHIFEDMLQGHLLLNTRERLTLLSDWIWIMNMERPKIVISEASLLELITKIVLTFPLLEQQKFYNTWAMSDSKIDPRDPMSTERILNKSYSIWLTHVTREAAKHEPNS